jgi:hypothetical protein
VNLSERIVTAASSARITPAGGDPTGKERVTAGAARYCEFPAWVAVRVTCPVDPACVSTFPASEAGPEISDMSTGSPLDAVAESVRGGLRVVTVPGAWNVIVWARSDAKFAVTDLLEFMNTERTGDDPVESPVQPTNDDPGPAVATAVAMPLGGYEPPPETVPPGVDVTESAKNAAWTDTVAVAGADGL